jgi:hypothetical protein
MYMIKTTFIEFLMPENIGMDTKIMKIHKLHAEIWPKVGSRMNLFGFVLNKNMTSRPKKWLNEAKFP